MTTDISSTKRNFAIPDDLHAWAKEERVPQLNAQGNGKFDMTVYIVWLMRRDQAACYPEGRPVAAVPAKRNRSAPRKAVA